MENQKFIDKYVMQTQNTFLFKKLKRKENDISNLRKKLDDVLDELDSVLILLEQEQLKNSEKSKFVKIK